MDKEQKELQILSGNEQKAKDYINNKEKLKTLKSNRFFKSKITRVFKKSN